MRHRDELRGVADLTPKIAQRPRGLDGLLTSFPCRGFRQILLAVKEDDHLPLEDGAEIMKELCQLGKSRQIVAPKVVLGSSSGELPEDPGSVDGDPPACPTEIKEGVKETVGTSAGKVR